LSGRGLRIAGRQLFFVSGGRSTVETAVSEADSRATIRNVTGADERELLELLFRAFQRWPAFEIPVPPLEHLRWKMRSDPIAARHHLVSEIDDTIAAMMLLVVRRVRVKGRDCLARDGVDAAVDPRYQGQRIYGALLDHYQQNWRYSEFDLSFWYSTHPKMRQRSVRQGRKPLGNLIQVLQKPFRAGAIVARRRERHSGRIPAPLAVLRIKLESALNRLGHPPYWRGVKRTWSIATLERFDDRIDGFFDEAAQPFDFAVVKSKDYVNWRYCDPAAGRFTVRVAEQEGRLLGYLVLKITEGEGYIADLLALPERADVVRSLIEDAVRLFREAGVELASCWMISRHPYNPILRRYGFIDSRKDVGLRYRAVSLDERDLEFLSDPGARIHLTHGDSDWV